MTLQWDLSNTPLARSESTFKVPTEGELFALAIAMLLAEGQSYENLRSCELVLRRDQLTAVAEVFEYRIPELRSEVTVHSPRAHRTGASPVERWARRAWRR